MSEAVKLHSSKYFDQADAVRQWGGSVKELQNESKYRHLSFEWWIEKDIGVD